MNGIYGKTLFLLNKVMHAALDVYIGTLRKPLQCLVWWKQPDLSNQDRVSVLVYLHGILK